MRERLAHGRILPAAQGTSDPSSSTKNHEVIGQNPNYGEDHFSGGGPEKALNWPKSKSTVKETPPGRGAKPTAQSRRRPPIEDEPYIPLDDFEIDEKEATKLFKPMTREDMVELQKMAVRIQKIMGVAKQDAPIKRPNRRR